MPIILEFSCQAEDGIMDCWLVLDDQRHHLEGFGAFPPFGNLLGFVRALASNNLPHEFSWQEEYARANFRALPAENGSDLFRLQIVHDDETVIDADFDRLQVANSLLESLRNFALDCPESGTDWEFPYFLIEDFERARANGFAPNTDPDALQQANFVFEHFDDRGSWTFLPIVTSSAKKVNPSFRLWIGSWPALPIRMGEGPRLWRLWFDLLEKISRAELPFEAIFDCRKPREECDNDLDFLTQQGHAYGFRAEPAAQSEQFRLVIWRVSTEASDETPFLNARLERSQFIGAFVKAFDEFLHTDYLTYLAGNPEGFDLRSLPIERL